MHDVHALQPIAQDAACQTVVSREVREFMARAGGVRIDDLGTLEERIRATLTGEPPRWVAAREGCMHTNCRGSSTAPCLQRGWHACNVRELDAHSCGKVRHQAGPACGGM